MDVAGIQHEHVKLGPVEGKRVGAIVVVEHSTFRDRHSAISATEVMTEHTTPEVSWLCGASLDAHGVHHRAPAARCPLRTAMS